MANPNTAILNFNTDLTIKGEPLGKKLFAVTFVSYDIDEGEEETVWTEIWRGGNKKSIEEQAKQVAKDTDKDGMLNLETKLRFVVEIGTLR